MKSFFQADALKAAQNQMANGEDPSGAQRHIRGRGLKLGVLWQGGAQLATYLVSFALMPLVINQAGVGVYGAFVVFNSLCIVSVQIFTLGAGYKCRRNLPSAFTPHARAVLFLPSASSQFVSYLLAAVVIAGVMPWLSHRLAAGEQPLNPGLVPLMILALYLVTLGEDYFRYTHRIAVISRASVARSICYPALIAALAFAGQPITVNMLFLGQAVGYIVPSLVVWAGISREVPLAWKFDGWTQFQADVRLGFPLVSAVIVENLLLASDRYILSGMLSPVHAGAYAAAAAVGSLILVVPRVTTTVLPTALAHAVDNGEQSEAEELVNRVLKYYLVLCVPFVFGATMLAEPILVVLANQEVADLGRWVVPLVAFGSAIYGYTYVVFNTLFVQRNTRLWLKANVAAATVSITLNLLLVGFFHRIEVAGVTMILSYAVSSLVIHRRREKSWRIGVKTTLLGRILLSALVMAIMVWGTRGFLGGPGQSWRVVAVEVPLGIVSYVAAIRVWKILSWDEIRALVPAR